MAKVCSGAKAMGVGSGKMSALEKIKSMKKKKGNKFAGFLAGK